MLSFNYCIDQTKNMAEDTFLNNLDLRQKQRTLLAEARLLVRSTLRAALERETAAFSGDEKPISPRFFTQGSWDYKTINRPTHVPPQQADMDDGCYLPMTFARSTSPKRAATWFFEVADRALKALVQKKGWKEYDDSKKTCCRVIIDDENHVDVPLYAMRDEQFALLKKSLTTDQAARFAEAATADLEDEAPLDWSKVADEDVLLAHRNGMWKPSNPKAVSAWVRSAVDIEGEQLRTLWRASKGWRDHNFKTGGPSSIALMVIVEREFQEVKGRADLALMAAAKSIRHGILGPVPAPWDSREDLNRLTEEDRKMASQRAAELEQEIAYCIRGTLPNAAQYLRRLRDYCGRHFSQDVSRVKEVSAHEVVHAYPAATVAAPAFRGDSRSA